MGPVQQAVRSQFRGAATTLHTIGRSSPFVLDRVDADGIVLLLGRGRHVTAIDWECLEGVVPFLRQRPGWVAAGGTYKVQGEIDTLDEHLKDCANRQTSRWVTVVLKEAGVVLVDPGPPLRLRLAPRFA